MYQIQNLQIVAEIEEVQTYSKQSKFHTAFTNLHLVSIETEKKNSDK